jgi:hypothetical protein
VNILGSKINNKIVLTTYFKLSVQAPDSVDEWTMVFPYWKQNCQNSYIDKSKNTEASEAINETYKYCSGKIFHLREYVNFNFSFFKALVAPKSGTDMCHSRCRATPKREHSDFKLIMRQILAHI